jgi:hypothetical protein
MHEHALSQVGIGRAHCTTNAEQKLSGYHNTPELRELLCMGPLLELMRCEWSGSGEEREFELVRAGCGKTEIEKAPEARLKYVLQGMREQRKQNMRGPRTCAPCCRRDIPECHRLLSGLPSTPPDCPASGLGLSRVVRSCARLMRPASC